jgi:hypothetical protein
MKALFKVSPSLQFEVEEEKQTDMFESIASVQEVFGIVGNEKCVLCGSDKLKFIVRPNKDEDKFYEIRCQGFTKDNRPCGGKLALSVNKGKEGTMYPIRKLKNGLPAKVADEGPFDFKTNGWHRWEGQKNSETGVTTSTEKSTKGTTTKK